MTSIREQSNRIRDLPLEEVAGKLGGSRNQHDKQRWDFSACSVWIGKGFDSQRFFDHRAGRGGGGAIDLTMHVLGCDFKAALASFLSLSEGAVFAPPPDRGTAQHDAVEPAFIAPTSCPQYLPRLSEYLSQTRCLPADIVAQMINRGLIYPDSRRNAVFLCHSPGGQVTGAELRGTGAAPFKGMAPNSRRGIGFFTLDHASPSELVIVESALDALAYRVLFSTSAACIASTAGILPECPVLLELAERQGIANIVVAYDNDEPGEIASERLIRSLSGNGRAIQRRQPWLKDWNEIVIVACHAEARLKCDLAAEVL